MSEVCVEGCGADLSVEQHRWDCPIFDVEEWVEDQAAGLSDTRRRET